MNGNGSVAFRVYGKPKTQGSMWSPKGSNAVIHQSGKKLEGWRHNVGEEASVAWRSPPVTGPVKLHLVFKFQRPKLDYGTGKNSDVIKDSAPKRHTKLPDTDKLIRAILDSLTGIIYLDDKQVDEIHASKTWVRSGEGALVIIETEAKDE